MRNLKIIRTIKGLTIKDACALSKIAPSVWCRIETGKQSPNVTTLRKMAKVLGCNLEDILREKIEIKEPV